MTWLEQLKNASLIEPLGWTILHSLWQGTAIAILAAILLRLTRSRSAQLRYVITCLALFSMLFAAIATFAELRPPKVSPALIENVPVRLVAPTVQPIQASEPIETIRPVTPTLSDRIRPILPSLALAWIAGVFLLGAYHAGGWMLLRRLRFQSRTIADVSSRAMLTDLIAAMRITRTVQLCESVLVQVPTVIGWLSPIILFPASAMVGLSPPELRGLLAHELAHIRRHDYLINLLQTVIETLLFYHPATWWLSNVIRQERENCCDDLAATFCDRTIYAQALATMESLRQSPQLALSAKGSALLPRIRRILGLPPLSNRRTLSSGIVSSLILLAVIAGGFALNASRSSAEASTTQTSPTTVPQTQGVILVSPSDADLKASTSPTTQGMTYSIGGAVKQPGQYAIPPRDFRLTQALDFARGLTKSADDIFIIRGAPGNQRIIYVALDELKTDAAHVNVVIHPGDVIQIPFPDLTAQPQPISPPSSNRHSLRGRMTDAATGKPIANVTVNIYTEFGARDLIGSVMTDANGQYQFDNPSGATVLPRPSGPLDILVGIEIDSPGLCSSDGDSSWHLKIPAGNTVTKDFPLVPSGKLIGTVNNHLGQGNANLKLCFSSKNHGFSTYATTDRNGQFTTETLFPDDYVIYVVDAAAEYPHLATIQVQANQTPQIELHYDPPTTTLSAASTQPAAGAPDLASGGNKPSHENISRASLADLQSVLHALDLQRQNDQSKLDAAIQAGGDNTFAVEQARGYLNVIDEERDEVAKQIAAKSAEPRAATTQPVGATANGIVPNTPATQPALPETGEYYVSGMPRSGVYGIGGKRVTILQALIAAGLTESTPGNLVAVLHEQGGHDAYVIPNLRQQDNQVSVLPGDTLMVVQRSGAASPEYYVGGDVPRVGVYSIPPRGINVLQAIIAAGADPFTIIDAKVEVRHRLLSDTVEIQRTTISDLMNAVGKQPLIQSDDTILVRKSAASQPSTRP